MDVQFYGANCLLISTKHSRLVIDDNLNDLGPKSIIKAGDIVLFTGSHGDVVSTAKILIDRPGEYEVSGVSIYGIDARAHVDEEQQKTATMYKIIADDLRVLVVGHIYPELSDAQLEAVGTVDLMIVPVGGNGYTLDGVGALKLIKKIEPKIVVPTHYDDPTLKFSVPQQTLEQALKSLGMEPKEKLAKLKLNPANFGEDTQLIVLE